MSLDERDRQHLIEHRIDRAINTIEDVQFLINNDKLAMAVNRVYYDIFYAMSALALKHQFVTSKHQQLIGWFNKNYIKEKKIDIKFGEILRKAFEKRSKGDYDDWVEFERDEVGTLFNDMKRFINQYFIFKLGPLNKYRQCQFVASGKLHHCLLYLYSLPLQIPSFVSDFLIIQAQTMRPFFV